MNIKISLNNNYFRQNENIEEGNGEKNKYKNNNIISYRYYKYKRLNNQNEINNDND